MAIIELLKSWVVMSLAEDECCFDQSFWNYVNKFSRTCLVPPHASCYHYKAVGLLINKAMLSLHEQFMFFISLPWQWIDSELSGPSNIRQHFVRFYWHCLLGINVIYLYLVCHFFLNKSCFGFFGKMERWVFVSQARSCYSLFLTV